MLQLRPAPALAAKVFAVVAVALGSASCGRAVTVDAAALDSVTEGACQVLHDQLPRQIASQNRVAVADDNGTTAAWGGPAIVWRCGVSQPAALKPTSQLVTVDGKDWFPETLTDGVRFTTTGATPHVEITFPSTYPTPAALLAELQ